MLVSGPNRVDLAPARGGHGRAGHPPRDRARGPRPDRVRHRRDPADRHRASGAGDHGSRPRALPGRLGRGRAADRGLPASRPATLRILANATVAPIAEERPATAGPRPPRHHLTATGTGPPRSRRGDRRTPQRHDHVPGRPACALALGRQRLGGRRSSPCRRPAGRWSTSGRGSPPTPTRCAAPSSGSRDRAARGRSASRPHLRRAARRSTGTRRAAGRGLRLPYLRPRGGDRRAALGPPSATPISRSSVRRGCARLVQAELETFAIEADGTVAWRVAHSDVVTAAEIVGGRLVLTSFDGQVSALDPATGR